MEQKVWTGNVKVGHTQTHHAPGQFPDLANVAEGRCHDDGGVAVCLRAMKTEIRSMLGHGWVQAGSNKATLLPVAEHCALSSDTQCLGVIPLLI